MKRIFLLVLMFSMAGAVIGETTETDKQETTTPQQPTAEESAYRADTATILKLIGNIRDFRSGFSDTQVQATARQRKLKEALVRINARYKGTSLTLQRAELDDVTADTALTAKGIAQSRQLIEKMRQDPGAQLLGIGKTNDLSDLPYFLRLSVVMALGEDCWKETGKYNATYSIPVSGEREQYRRGIAIGQDKKNDDGTTVYEYLDVEIVKTYPNENSVINLSKGSVAPLTGTIRGVLYEDAGDKLTIWID